MSIKSLLEKAGVLQEEEQIVVKKQPVVQNKPIEQSSFNTVQNAVIDVSLQSKISSVIDQTLANYKKDTAIDYLDLINSVEQLKISIPDEKIRFVSALTVAKAMNKQITKVNILSSIDYYLTSLDTIRSDFVQSNKAQFINKVKTKQKELADVISLQDTLHKQLEQINSKLINIQSNKNTLQDDINKQSDKLQKTMYCFQNVYNKKRSEILSHKDKINTYLT